MRKTILTAISVLFISAPVWAEEPEALDFDLAHDAVQLSAQVDVYNHYCDKESALADGFIDKFEKRGITAEQKEKLLTLKADVTKFMEEDLATRKPECKTVDYLLEQLKAMRILKAVSFALNGVDPSTLPDAGAHIPLDELLKEPI